MMEDYFNDKLPWSQTIKICFLWKLHDYKNSIKKSKLIISSVYYTLLIIRIKTPFEELDVFRAIFFLFSIFLAAPKAFSFLILNCFFMSPALYPGFSNLQALSSTLTTFLFSLLSRVIEATSRALLLTVQYLSYLWDSMLHKWSPDGSQPPSQGGRGHHQSWQVS